MAGVRLVTCLLAAGLWLHGCATGPATRAPRAEPAPGDALRFPGYNLVLVSFDALQAAHLGSLGYPRDVTPTIDAVARDGFSFSNAVSVASWTVPASMTWFTGVMPSSHGLVNKFAVYTPEVQKLSKLGELAPHLVTLAQVFRDNGYATGGFTGNAGVSGGFGYDQGFDRYFFEKGTFGSMAVSAQQALEWLEEHRGEKFFLFLHGYDVHGQSAPAGGFDYRFVEAGYDGRYTGSPREQEALREEGLATGRVALREEDVRFWRAVYDEKIQRTDAVFARFLEAFERLGLADRTIFLLTSDHGTEFSEHQRFDHGFSLYGELLRVPLVLKLPGVSGGRVIEDRVSSLDVMPTVVDLLGLRVSPEVRRQMQGESLVPALGGEPVARDVFSETDYRQYTYKRSITTPEGWKFIYTLETRQGELYDLRRDPGETVNLVGQEPRTAYELEQRLFRYFEGIGHDLHGRRWEVGLNPVYPSQAPGGTAEPPP